MQHDVKKWRVRIHRWDIYEVREVEARSEEDAEERALALHETQELWAYHKGIK